MKINSVEFRNFGSYGNRWQEIKFIESGAFIHVFGHNGAGKSQISDAIKFAIYGKLENKKLKDVANRINKHLEIKINLDTHKGNIQIERGVEPGHFRLYFNGKLVDKAGKKSVQDYLEEELLEMPFYVFSNTLSLSINDFKSFIRMNNFDKRAIIDKIFGLQILNQMREILKLQSKKMRETVDNILASNTAYSKTLSSSKKELEDLEANIQASKGERKAFLEHKVIKFEEHIIKSRVTEQDMQKTISNAELLKNTIEINVRQDYQSLKEIEKKIALYENLKCPECESDLTTDFHQEILKQYNDTKQQINVNLSEKEIELKKCIFVVADLKKKMQEHQKQMHKAEAQLNIIHKELREINSESNNDAQTSSLNRIVEDAKKNIEKNLQEKSIIEKKIQYNALIEEILGEKGVKQLAIKSILPSLNSEIQKLTTKLGIEHRIIFDEEFNAKLTHFGIEVSADTLSTGESKKVDFAVLMSIIRLMKMKYTGVNLLFLDELFSSLDADAIHHVLKILDEASKEYEMNIFIISHFPLTSTSFDYIIEVKKEKSYSRFEMNKVT